MSDKFRLSVYEQTQANFNITEHLTNSLIESTKSIDKEETTRFFGLLKIGLIIYSTLNFFL